MTTAGAGFIYLWIGVLAVFFIGRALFDIWYHNRDGFWDWWYSEVNRDPNAGHWYYGSKERRISRL